MFGESTLGSCQAITNMQAIVKLMVAMLLAQGIASAAVLFEDTFDRGASRNLDASLAGITDNTGSALAAVINRPNSLSTSPAGPKGFRPRLMPCFSLSHLGE